MVDSDANQVLEYVERNSEGKFYQIFQPNKWRKQKEAAAKAEMATA
jgi:hypothetical protein